MAPKLSRQRENLEKNKASSSSRAREQLLSNPSDYASASTFIGFDAFRSCDSKTESRIALRGAYDGDDHEIAIVLKALGKKGIGSKLKALGSLQREIIPSRPPIALRPLLSSFFSFYVLEFHALSDEVDTVPRCIATTQLRETWNAVLLALVEKMKPKAFSPHLSRLLPAWFLAVHDASNQVGKIATLAFENLFPTWQQRREIVETEFQGLLETFKVYLEPLNAKKKLITQEKRGKKEGKRSTPTENIQNQDTENLGRCVGASLRAMNTILKYLTRNSDDISDSKMLDSRVESLIELTTTPHFARLAVDRSASIVKDNKDKKNSQSASYQPAIRHAMWQLMRTIICNETLCRFLSSSPSRSEHYAKLILGQATIERAIGNHSDAWELVLEFLQRFPEIFGVGNVDQYFDVAVRPRVLAQIRAGFHGEAANFRMILPFVSLLPTKILAKSQKNSQLIVDILQQFWQFLCKNGREREKQVALSSLFELLTASMSIFVLNDREELVLSFGDNLTQAGDAYVDQFRDMMLALFASAYAIPISEDLVTSKFTEKLAMQYGKELLTLFKALSRSSRSIAQHVGLPFTRSFQRWISTALLSGISSDQLNQIETRWMMIFELDQKHSQDSNAHVLPTECIEKLTAHCITAILAEQQSPNIDRLLTLLQLLFGLNKVYGVDQVLSHYSVEEAYSKLYQPLLQHLAPLKYANPASEQLEETFFVVLKLVHYLLPKMTGNISTFLTQFFRDAKLEDCLSGFNVLQSLQFPLTPSILEEWLQINGSASMFSELWQSESIDHFVLQNLEIADPAFGSIAALLMAALGEEEACPLLNCATFLNICRFLMDKEPSLCRKLWPIIVSFFTKVHRIRINLKEELERTEMSFVTRVFFDFTFDSNQFAVLKALFEVWNSELQKEFMDGVATSLSAYLEEDQGTELSLSVWTDVTAKYFEMTQWEAKDSDLLKLHNIMDAIGGIPPIKGPIPRFLTCFGALTAENATTRATIATFLASQSCMCLLELLIIDIFHRVLWIRLHFHQLLCDFDEMMLLATNSYRFIAESLVFGQLYTDIADSDVMDAAWRTIVCDSNALMPLLHRWKSVLTLDASACEVAYTSEQMVEVGNLATAVVTCLVAPDRVTSAVQTHLDNPTDMGALQRFLQVASLHNSPTLSFRKVDRPLPIAILTALKKLQCDVSVETMALLKTNVALSVQEWHEMVDLMLATLESESPDSSIAKECIEVSKNLIRQLFSSADNSIGSMQAHKDRTLWLMRRDCSEAYPLEQLHCRNKAIQLFSAAVTAQNTSAYVFEFASNHREALFVMLLYYLRDGIYLPAYMQSGRWESSSFGSIKACLTLAESFACKPAAQQIFSALFASLDGQHEANQLLMRTFGDVDAIMNVFSPEFPVDLLTARLVYAILVGCQTLQLQDPTSPSDQDDEQSIEKIALEIVPLSLQRTLERIIRVNGPYLTQKLFVWDFFLQLFPTTLREPAISVESSQITSALTTFAAQKNFLETLLTECAEFLAQVSRSDLILNESTLLERWMESPEKSTASFITTQIGTQVFFQTAMRLPCILRAWWNDQCSRSLRSWVTKFFIEHVTPALVRHELEAMERLKDQNAWDPKEITVKGSRVSRRITATYVKDDCVLEMVLQIPDCYPLYSVDVACGKRVGVSEDRWRRGVLHIVQTCAQNGALMDAVMLWKRNVDQEFQGVVPCPICYWILYPKTMAFPNLTCKTCKTTYHKGCLYKWFMQSGKSVCTICQQPL
uniref:E3 ubiquitin-protein ligase listerin n=1 Tax=Albugo laibachii Nc14 TaxID=890382 RepID=F0WJD5_9STRA|nr:conserved hypothetical protein [Albugo laibachii Nc14]|eukprot:CCA21382.1 conserved hypothetical protein [Albugo laibachii Nc14]